MFFALLPVLLAAQPVGMTFSKAEVQKGTEGQIEWARGVLTAPLTGDLSDSARKFVLQHRGELKLPSDSNLGPASTFATRWGGSIHLPQTVDGLEVDAAKVIVTLDNQKRVVGVSSSLVSYTQVSRNWVLTANKALQVAAQGLEGAVFRPDGVPYGGTKRKFFFVQQELRAGYLVHVSTLSHLQNWYFAVDAENGNVFWKQNRVHFSDEASVYANSPGTSGVGVTPTSTVELSHFKPNRTSGLLEGDQIETFNCCPNENCATGPTAKKKHTQVQFQTSSGVMNFDVAICDRFARASNDVTVNPLGNYVFTPVDPPKMSSPSQDDPADSDLFSEVNAYYHVNKVYDFFRDLSSGGNSGLATFQMRDAKRGKRPAVWSNALEADIHSATQNAQGVYVSDSLQRVDNAAFVGVENFDSFLIPAYKHDADTLMIYQGDYADFGYDAPVLWHEFTHGVIYSTANFQYTVEFDGLSANEEGYALHEGFADYFAAAFGQNPEIGTYVGSRFDKAAHLRTLDNSYSCPSVLSGESHGDSQHFAGALWEARTQYFQGEDQGRTFDAAVYAALVSMTPNTNFSKAARAIVTQVQTVFGAKLPAAGEQMENIFKARGVLNCSKVWDVTSSADSIAAFSVLGAESFMAIGGNDIPGPYQMKITLPKGAKSIRMFATYYSWGGSSSMKLKLLGKKNQPIVFKNSASKVTQDSEHSVVPTLSGQSLKATLQMPVPCGQDVYLALANTGSSGRTVYDLSFSVVPLSSCDELEPKPTTPETPAPPPPPPAVKVDAISNDGTLSVTQVSGCHTGAGTSAETLLLLACWGIRRRKKI